MPVPDYILRLRERFGHNLLWLPGVTAVVIHNGHVLLVCRADNGEWAPVTGIVDPGEHPAHAAVREVTEETGISCEAAWFPVTDLPAMKPLLHTRIVTALNHTGPTKLL